MSKTAGQVARDLSIDSVEANNALAAQVLYDFAVHTAREMETFTADDVWSVAPVSVREPRVMGAVMRRLRSEGFAEPLMFQREGYRPINHARPQRVWKSLVYKPGSLF